MVIQKLVQKHQSLSHRKEIFSWWLKNPAFLLDPLKPRGLKCNKTMFSETVQKSIYTDLIYHESSLEDPWRDVLYQRSYKPLVWRVAATGILKKGTLVPGKSWYLHMCTWWISIYIYTQTDVYEKPIQYLYVFMYKIIRICVWLTYILYIKYIKIQYVYIIAASQSWGSQNVPHY